MGPLEIISAAHVVSSIPNFYRLEHSHPLIEEHARLLTEPYRVENGHLVLNGKPGLGYDLNEDWLKSHAVDAAG
jgi:L-alanine-DL-glutamate epimerase-like enolase superfamily enzyme